MLNFNKDSLFQALPNNLLILSIHLTSKSEQNQLQMGEMKQTIQLLKKQLPNLHIIAAGDLNSPLNPDFEFPVDEKQKMMSVFPDTDKYITANKKRTMMQPQRHKAEKLDQMSKDYIFTDLPMHASQVQLINGRPIIEGNPDNLLLPNE